MSDVSEGSSEVDQAAKIKIKCVRRKQVCKCHKCRDSSSSDGVKTVITDVEDSSTDPPNSSKETSTQPKLETKNSGSSIGSSILDPSISSKNASETSSIQGNQETKSDSTPVTTDEGSHERAPRITAVHTNEVEIESQSLLNEENKNELHSKEKKNESLPAEKNNESLPEAKRNESLPETKRNESLPKEKKNEPLPEENKNESLPEENKNEPLPEDDNLQNRSSDFRPRSEQNDTSENNRKRSKFKQCCIMS